MARHSDINSDSRAVQPSLNVHTESTEGSSRNHATEQNTFGTQIMFLSQKNLWTRGAKASKATPTWFPTLPEAPRLPLPPSKQPLKLPTTKNDLAATQELPDPFLSAFSRSFSSNDVWINYRHCRHSNRNHLKYWPMQSSSRAQLESSTVFESDRKKLDKGCKWKSLAWRSMQCKAS